MQPELTVSPASCHDDFLEALGRFQQWRRARVRGSRIPEPLWQLALELAGRQGMGQTAKVLGLNLDVLRRRLHPEAESRTGRPNRPKKQTRFVELPQASSRGSKSCTIEFKEGAGESPLRVELAGFAPEELGALIRVLRSGQSA